MSTKIRLTKIGKKNSPSYRIVATSTRSKRNGDSLEILGFYNPSANPPAFEYNKETLDRWVKNGALLTTPVKKLIEGTYKFTKYSPKSVIAEDKKEE